MTGSKAKTVVKDAAKKAEDKKAGKRKPAVRDEKPSKRQVTKEKKAKKDPNKPKRPASGFFVFLEEFRKTYKADHPNVKSVSVVGKAGGEKWKALSDAERAPYLAKAEKRKAEYEKLIAAYNKKPSGNADEAAEESDKSKSEINNDEEDESGEEDEEEE